MTAGAGSAPAWFDRAISAPRETGITVVDGVPISWHGWGDPADDLVVLVHGGAAHAAWWHPIAPRLSENFRVLAVDLSGHGDSGWAPSYSFPLWAAQLEAVVLTHDSRRAQVVGHSMGGLVALAAAVQFPDRFSAVVTVDLPDEAVRRREVPAPHEVRDRPFRPTREEVLARFRVEPVDAATKPYVQQYVAVHSIREFPQGWRWKFDPQVQAHGHFDPNVIHQLRRPISMIAAERGLLSHLEVRHLKTVLESGGVVVDIDVIADSGHHIVLDQPLALAEAVRSQLMTQRARSMRDSGNSCVL